MIDFSDIFGGVTGMPTQNRGGANGETLNPWATSSPSMFSPEASASFKPNPTNPFLWKEVINNVILQRYEIDASESLFQDTVEDKMTIWSCSIAK